MVNNYQKFSNIAKVQRVWQSEFKNSNPPSRSAILYNVEPLERLTKSLVKFQKWPKSVRTSEIKRFVTETPSLSTNKLAASAHISISSARRILVNELHLKPYIW